VRRLNNYQARSARPFSRRCNIWKRATGMETENRTVRDCVLSLSFFALSFFHIFVESMRVWGWDKYCVTALIFQRYAGTSALRVCVVDKAERLGSIAWRWCPPFCHAARHYISATTSLRFPPWKPRNKRTRWKTTASPEVNWRFEVRQDRYVRATARRFLFSPVARNEFQELNHYRWLWQRGISILSRFSLFHALSERC